MVWVFSDGARISGNHRSFQIGTMVNTATVAMAGRISGTTTWKKMRNSSMPSQRAASFSSLGTWPMNSDRIMMASGRPWATYTSTRAVRVLTSPRLTMVCRIDTVPSRIGTMMPKAKNSLSQRLPLNLYSVSAQAAIAPNSRMKKSEATVTVKLLPKYSHTSERPSTLW